VVTPPHPKFIQIETNILCNASCPFCPQHKVERRPKIMEDAVWHKIIDETRGLGVTYRPFLINEPLTDKRLGEILRYIRLDDTAKIELNTNGGLMTRAKALDILGAGIEVIRFSIDGFSADSFAKSRIGLDYEETVKRTLGFIELSGQRDGAGRIEVRMIETEFTRHEIEPFLTFWREAGAEPVITTLYHWPWEPGVSGINRPCLKILEEMFIYVNGQVTLCCWDTLERAVIGDITREHTLEVWNGETNARFRRLLSEGRRDRILLCSRCDAYKDHVFEKSSSSLSQ